MSSLSAQFAQNASLNSALLVDRTRKKPTASYLFTGRGADQHDLDTIHALGQNALIQLSSISPVLQPYEDILFSEQAKAMDRTLLTSETNEELDRSLHKFLTLLGPYMMEAPTGKVIEWLVRRFRINEFNINSIMTLFLPYHETPHFRKMVTILQIEPGSLWTFLSPYKSAAQHIPRVSLVSEMLRSGDFSRFVVSLLPAAVKGNHVYRVLLAFNAATIHEFIKRSKVLDEGTVAYLLPAILEPLQQKLATPSKDAILGSYILLAALSHKCELAPPAIKAILGSMASSARLVSTKHFVSAAVAVFQAQTELEKISEGSLKAILQLNGINEELCAACGWYGSEKFLLPIAKRLCTKVSDGVTIPLLENIIANPSVSNVVLNRLASLLMNTVVSSDDALSERRLLSFLQQRHASIVQRVAKELSEENDDNKDIIEQLIMTLSTTKEIASKVQTSGNANLVIASAHADSNVRAIAIRNLVFSLKGTAPESEESTSLRSVLLARISDHNVEVLEALYQQPEVITPILTSNLKDYVDALSMSIATPGVKPRRAVLRLHFAFLLTYIVNAAVIEDQEDIFNRIIFPFLLFSKPRQHTAELVWNNILPSIRSSKILPIFELLKGCGEVVKLEESSDVTVGDMVAFNTAISSKIAENILKSDKFSMHLAFLTSALQEPNSHTRALGYLTIKSLVERLSGSHQIKAAYNVLEVMKLGQVTGIDDISEDQDLAAIIDEGSIEKSVVTKPNSKSTLSWLQISVLFSISKIARPTNGLLNWMADPARLPTESHDQYLSSIRTLYQLVNASTTVPILSMGLLQTLLLSLKDDALAFLGGTWLSARSEMELFKRVALLHAASLLEAHQLEQDGMDFQTILPSLLIILQSHDAQTRRAAFECITRLRIIADGHLSHVYKFDLIYGQTDQALQYLDQDDLTRYLDAIVGHRDHFENDSSYLSIFHGHHLAKFSGEQKREAEYKKRVLCFFLSHVNALPSRISQAALIKSVQTVSNKAKLQILLPMIQSLLTAEELPNDDLTRGLLSCFNASAAKDINDQGQSIWLVYVNLIRRSFSPGVPEPLQEILAEGLESKLYGKLDQDRQFELCNILLEIGSQDADSQKICKRLLSNILNGFAIMARLLDGLSPSNTSAPRANKRMKTMETSDHSSHQLTFLVEILGNKSLPGSIDLISRLLETLNKVVQSHTSQADVNYIGQLLMSAVEGAANKILEIPNLSPSAIRLDVLVELIRVTDNPQTFHQALLLMASLARLAPESVLHNVMPVFTFMGSNVFHRDDTYSFKVVQQTIEGIVPVMVRSLKNAHTERLQLFIGAKEFIRVFTDAANHIPRHRRNNFFAHFVNALGPDDFLAPVCMLLIEKVATRIPRQTEDEMQTSFALPTSLFRSMPLPTQIETMTEIIDESQRLARRVVNPLDAQPIFLEISSDGESSTSTILRRRAQALALFAGRGFKPSLPNAEHVSLGRVVAKLISLAMLQGSNTQGNQNSDISLAARSSLNRLLGTMSALDFVQSVSSMLDSGNVEVQAGALLLLSQRLEYLSLKSRREVASTVIKIISSIQSIIVMQREGPANIFALQALKSVASTVCASEENALAELVPTILTIVKKSEMAIDAWNVLLPMSTKLGPRIIPHYRAIVGQCLANLREGNTSFSPIVFSTLQGLLSSIPNFWTAAEVTSVADLYIERGARTFGTIPMTRLIKTLTKRIPAKILLPALLDVWTRSQKLTSDDERAVYFDLLSRALRSADRPIVVEHLRPLFKIFMDSLATTSPSSEMENYIISAFKELVIKLNETAFRPLFRRLYDWAFVSDDDNIDHRIVFIDLYLALQGYFKGLMSPYMSFLLLPYIEILKSYSSGSRDNVTLWRSVIQSLTKSLIHDDSGFWRDDKLRQITSALIEQVDVVVKLNDADGKQLLQECVASLVEAVTDDTLLKTINLNILMHTRSEDVKLRIYALNCSESLWRTYGSKLLGFVAETTTFIAECSEDENDMVVKESFNLKNAVESIAGKIDGL